MKGGWGARAAARILLFPSISWGKGLALCQAHSLEEEEQQQTLLLSAGSILWEGLEPEEEVYF